MEKDQVLTKTQYVHYRFKESNGDICPFGGYTLYYEPDVEANRSFIGIAKCSIMDNYSKECGRRIANHRAKSTAKITRKDVSRVENRLLNWADIDSIARVVISDDIEEQIKRHANRNYFGLSVIGNRDHEILSEVNEVDFLTTSH